MARRRDNKHSHLTFTSFFALMLITNGMQVAQIAAQIHRAQ